MPAFSTHYAFAVEMKEFIEQNCNFQLDTNALMIGTQGPDIFFFHRAIPLLMYGKSYRKTGSAMHRSKPSDVFECAAKYISKSKEKEIALSYFYGYILHYALDRNCHPYIFCYQKKMQEKMPQIHHSSIHNMIELGLDAYIIKNVLGYSQTEKFHTTNAFIPNERIAKEISVFLSYLIKKTTLQNVDEKIVYQAIYDTETLQKNLYDETGIKKAILETVEKFISPFVNGFKISVMIRPKYSESIDFYANTGKLPWSNPWQSGIIRHDSFIEVFEKSKQDAKELILGFNKIFNNESDGYAVTQNKSFLTGVEIQ